MSAACPCCSGTFTAKLVGGKCHHRAAPQPRSADGTLQSKACSMVCPQLLAKADIRAIRGHSGSTRPKRSNAPTATSPASSTLADLQAVLDTLVQSGVRLCEADSGHIAHPNEACLFQLVATYGMSPELIAVFERIPFKAGRDSVMGRALLERRAVHIVDSQTDRTISSPPRGKSGAPAPCSAYR